MNTIDFVSKLTGCLAWNIGEYTDRISTICTACTVVSNKLPESGFCRSASASSTDQCTASVLLNANLKSCYQCSEPLILSLQRTCVTTCETGQGIFSVSNLKFCVACSEHCNTCTQAGQNLECTDCQPGFEPFKGFCSSTVCGDGNMRMSFNKECDPADPATQNLCSSDCMKLDPSECLGSVCKRKIF